MQEIFPTGIYDDISNQQVLYLYMLNNRKI